MTPAKVLARLREVFHNDEIARTRGDHDGLRLSILRGEVRALMGALEDRCEVDAERREVEADEAQSARLISQLRASLQESANDGRAARARSTLETVDDTSGADGVAAEERR